MSRTEANTQAEFYFWARLFGLHVELELSTPVGRLDIAIMDEKRERVRAIIECKRDGTTVKEWGYQMIRYRSIGAPLYWLNKFEAAEEMAEMIAKTHADDEGISLAEIREIPRFRRGTRLMMREERRRLVESNGRFHIPY